MVKPQAVETGTEKEIGNFELHGRRYTIYQSINETRIWEDGEDEATLVLPGRYEWAHCKAAMIGWFRGLNVGIKQGADKVRLDLRTLIGATSGVELNRLDRRIDEVEAMADGRSH